MPGALPDAGNGALVIRDSNGACLAPAGVTNAYCPPATFESTCDLTALPNDCTAKIVPSQINGIVSEMLCFAATLSPFGTWNCNSTCNLSSMFTAWINSTAEGGLTDTIGNVICNSAERAPTLAGDMAVYCDGEGNLFKATEPNCFCPPVEVNGVPAGAPDANDVPWRVDITDPNNRILYYWNPATNAWRRIGEPKHELFGQSTFSYPSLSPIPLSIASDGPGGAGLVVGTTTFTVPNSSPRAINVLMVLTHHGAMTSPDPTGDPVIVYYTIYDGTGTAGTALISQHTSTDNGSGNGTTGVLIDEYKGVPFVVSIPPGGRTFTSAMSVQNPSGSNTTLINPFHRIGWVGHLSENFN